MEEQLAARLITLTSQVQLLDSLILCLVTLIFAIGMFLLLTREPDKGGKHSE